MSIFLGSILPIGKKTTQQSQATSQKQDASKVKFDLDALPERLYRIQSDLFVFHGDAEHEVNVVLKEFEVGATSQNQFRTDERFDNKVNQVVTPLKQASTESLPRSHHLLETHQVDVNKRLQDTILSLKLLIEHENASVNNLNERLTERKQALDQQRQQHEQYITSQRTAIDFNIDLQRKELEEKYGKTTSVERVVSL